MHFNSFDFQEKMQNTPNGEDFSYDEGTVKIKSLFSDDVSGDSDITLSVNTSSVTTTSSTKEETEESVLKKETENPAERETFVINSEVARRIEEIEQEEKPTFPYTNEETRGIGPTFSSGYVAKVFNISSQQIRNITQMFYELLDVSRKPGGAVEYTVNAIAQIAAILRIKERNSFTFEQTKQALLSPEGRILTAGTEFEQFKELLNYNNKAVQEAVKAGVEESMRGVMQSMFEMSEEIKRLSEQQSSATLLIEDAQKDTKNTLQLLEQKDEQLEEYKKLSEQQQKTAETLKVSLDERTMQLEKMVAENEKLTTLLREQVEHNNKKKKWFFKK